MASDSSSSFRLPTTVVPSHYDLHLTPNFTTFKFDGRVEVTVEVADGGCTEVVCHAKKLDVSSVVADGDHAASDLTQDAEAERLTAVFPTALAPGAHKLVYTFQGTLNDDMAGFYRSSFTAPDGAKQWMATTQFEACDARRAFPCWDEPALKASFNVTLAVPADLTALSNMPCTSETTADGVKTCVFDKTPRMSTYLLAFIVGDLERVSGETAAGVTVSVWTTPGKKEQGRFAVDMGVHTLTYFTDYFEQPYPLPKMDMVAIPDFAAGAMENWGLVTYRETAVLVHPERSSASIVQRVAYVVGHQWFGNLVTMEWWSDLWLNEGFATWAGWMAVESKFPEWRVWEQFAAQDTQRAMGTDAMLSSHPIEVPIGDAKMVDQVFDALSYQKGACMILMLEKFLGASTFQAGMRLYLQKHKYSNAKTADLWASLGEASGAPVSDIMNTWTPIIGFPVVTVAEDGTVSQRRFLSTGLPSVEEDAHTWRIPVTCTTGTDGATTSTVMQNRDSADLLSRLSVKAGDFFKLNASYAGFFRVCYTDAHWATMGENLARLNAVDRLSLASDAYALSKAGILSPATVLQLWNKFKGDDSYAVWLQLSGDVSAMASLLESHPVFPVFERFVEALYANIVARVGWDAKGSDGHLGALLRTLVLKAAAGVASPDSELVKEGLGRFRKMVADPSSLHKDLHDVVMNLAVAHGGTEGYEGVLDMYHKNVDHSETRVKCLLALGKARDPALVARFLDWAVKSGEVRNQDMLYALMSLSTRYANRVATWAYARENWALLMEKYATSGMLVTHVATLPLRGFGSEEVAAEAEAFFEANPCPSASMGISRAIEAIRSQAKWFARDSGAIATYLESWAAAK